MLVLTRKTNETILLGDDIRIVILSVDGERVRIGIEAPRSMRIVRHELLVETASSNKEALKTSSFALRKKDDATKQG
jgi:carbon storage regulator